MQDQFLGQHKATWSCRNFDQPLENTVRTRHDPCSLFALLVSKQHNCIQLLICQKRKRLLLSYDHGR